MRKFLLAAAVLALSSAAALAHTITFTWTWPSARGDGSALPLSQIGNFVVYDASVPVPNLPGAAISCPVTFPPTIATGTCTTGTIAAGTHSYVGVVSDNATPPDAGANSSPLSVVVPLTGPNAITNFSFTIN